MATVSSLRSRRFANRVVEATQPFITFRLRQVWFALPLQSVQRVGPFNSTNDNSTNDYFTLPNPNETIVDQQPLKLINVDQQIFGGSIVDPDGAIARHQESAPEARQPLFLITLKNNQGEVLGLPIDSKPQLHRILPSCIIIALPISPPIYQTLNSFNAMVEATADMPTLLLLDLDKI